MSSFLLSWSRLYLNFWNKEQSANWFWIAPMKKKSQSTMNTEVQIVLYLDVILAIDNVMIR